MHVRHRKVHVTEGMKLRHMGSLHVTFVDAVVASQLGLAFLHLQATSVIRGEVHQRVVGQELPVQGLQDPT